MARLTFPSPRIFSYRALIYTLSEFQIISIRTSETISFCASKTIRHAILARIGCDNRSCCIRTSYIARTVIKKVPWETRSTLIRFRAICTSKASFMATNTLSLDGVSIIIIDWTLTYTSTI